MKRWLQPIETNRIRLRLLEERDLPRTLAWRNQPHIRRWFFYSEVITPEQHQNWFARYRDQDDDFVFVIEEIAADNRPVGQAAIYHIDNVARRAEFGRLMLGESQATGRGLAREATAALVEAAIDLFDLKEVYLEVLAENTSAIKVYRACGFQETGRTESVIRMSKFGDTSHSP